MRSPPESHPEFRRERSRDTSPVAPPVGQGQAARRPSLLRNLPEKSSRGRRPSLAACVRRARWDRRSRPCPATESISRTLQVQPEPDADGEDPRPLPSPKSSLDHRSSSLLFYFFEFVSSSAAFRHVASFTASSSAQ